jgi:serine/threonine-protein kinase
MALSMGHPFGTGSLVAGKYLVEGFLACGAMGMVLAARHVDLDAPRALKVPYLEEPAPEDLAPRFLAEARIAARLAGEHVARVYDAGVLESGTPYIVMERLVGTDLAEILGRRGGLPVGDAALYVAQACAGMAEVHAMGVVHRDLKPANLFLTHAGGSPKIKVIDFGVARSVSAPAGLHVEGSPAYMAPEQVSSGIPIDARADVWALGVTLYELLTGRAPFCGRTMVATFSDIVNGEPPPAEVLRPGLPAGILAVLSRCLQKCPASRFQGVEDLAAALAPFALDATACLPDLAIAPRPAWVDTLAGTTTCPRPRRRSTA